MAEAARQVDRVFFAALIRWYNEEHHHSGIGLLTPGGESRGVARLEAGAVPVETATV